MRIALYSDLHLEMMPRGTFRYDTPDADLVILAGDIGKHTFGMEWAAAEFRRGLGWPEVVYVAGNHEYYGNNLGLLDQLRAPKWKEAGVHFLEQDVLALPGVRILGCTLWSGFNLHGEDGIDIAMEDAGFGINDYRLIRTVSNRRLTPQDTLHLHRQSVQWLEGVLSKPFDGKTVVVTHFAPHRGCVAPRFKGSPLSPYFVTDLSHLMERHPIDVWCFGHTHTNYDFVAEGGCRVVSNQGGYGAECIHSFLPNFTFEI